MQNILKNWKTSATGVALLALAALEVAGVHVPGVSGDPGSLIVQAVAAFGFIVASDSSK